MAMLHTISGSLSPYIRINTSPKCQFGTYYLRCNYQLNKVPVHMRLHFYLIVSLSAGLHLPVYLMGTYGMTLVTCTVALCKVAT